MFVGRMTRRSDVLRRISPGNLSRKTAFVFSDNLEQNVNVGHSNALDFKQYFKALSGLAFQRV